MTPQRMYKREKGRHSSSQLKNKKQREIRVLLSKYASNGEVNRELNLITF